MLRACVAEVEVMYLMHMGEPVPALDASVKLESPKRLDEVLSHATRK